MSAKIVLVSDSEYQILNKERFCSGCGVELTIKLLGDYDTASGKPRAKMVCPMWMCGHTGHHCKYERKNWHSRRRCVWCRTPLSYDSNGW